MKLTSADKKIVKAFLNRDPGEKSSKKLWTDGTRLDGLWMGGAEIAEWKAGKLHFRGYDSRSQQTVAKAVVKEAPPKWMERVIHPESEWALPRKRNEGRGVDLDRHPGPVTGDYVIVPRGNRFRLTREGLKGTVGSGSSLEGAVKLASDDARFQGEIQLPVWYMHGGRLKKIADVPVRASTRKRNEGSVKKNARRARGTTAARYKQPRQGDYTVDRHRDRWYARRVGDGVLTARGHETMEEAIDRAHREAVQRGERAKPVFIDRGDEGWEVVAEVPLKRGRNAPYSTVQIKGTRRVDAVPIRKLKNRLMR